MVDGDFDDDPATVDTGANAFNFDGHNYNLTDARNITTIARGLQGLVQALVTARNPLSADGQGT